MVYNKYPLKQSLLKLTEKCVSDPIKSELDLLCGLCTNNLEKEIISIQVFINVSWFSKKNSHWHVKLFLTFHEQAIGNSQILNFVLFFLQIKWNRLLQNEHRQYPLYFCMLCSEPRAVRTKCCYEQLEPCGKKTAKFSSPFKHSFSLL